MTPHCTCEKPAGVSIGDAIVVVALLAFAMAWLAAFMFWAGGKSGIQAKYLNDVESWLLVAVMFGPPMWALGVVRAVVRRSA